jgi:hypothetical protein
MKKNILLLTTLFLSFLIVNKSHANEDNCKNIIQQSWDKYRNITSEYEKADILILHDDDRKEEKEIVRWTLFDSFGNDKILTKFIKPIRDNGLALLIWRNENRGDDQWLKLPSMKQARRISISDESKYFAGTDITYEDSRQLTGERVDDFSYRSLGNNTEYSIIEAEPKPGIESAYRKRIIYINNSNYAISKIEYFNSNNEISKIQNHDKIIILETGAWRIDYLEIINFETKRKTIITITHRKINTDINSNVFSKFNLENQSK